MTAPDIQPFVVHQALIEDHRHDGLRSGEGAVEVLGDGALLMLYGRFQGPDDAARATLVTRRSSDGGRTWSKPTRFRDTPPGALNVMSASLLRLRDGRLAAVHLLKRSHEDCRPVFQTSGDDGRTWTDPALIIDEPAYYVVNNDRLAQLSTGRLLVPFCRGDSSAQQRHCGCAWSDDGGRSWRLGDAIAIEKRNILRPPVIDEHYPSATEVFESGQVHAQEPGVLELSDGRVWMWARSIGGYAYRSVSTDAGETWSPFEAIADLPMPCGPQSIKRLPGSNRLIMLYNDRGTLPYGSPQFQWRRPLSIAVSDDDARTWRRHGQLEPDTVPSNCYYSICFDRANAVFTYYEGVMHTRGDGAFAPRNLASLKLKIVELRYFEL